MAKTYKNSKQIVRKIQFIVFALISFSLILISCKSEETDKVNPEFSMFGTWILSSAEFRETVDIDGDGPSLPMKDAKYFVCDLLHFYDNCGSIDDIPIHFTDIFTGHTGPSYYVDAICPEGQGVTSHIARYDYHASNQGIAWRVDELNDPTGLISWIGVLPLLITDRDHLDGKWTLYGYASLASSLPEPKPDLTFDFVLKQIE